ncbi:unnamed protein product [Wuchereria bancrofti]|uniref:Uncharacterized protein n=1 Tax=Wuchereria bancrofti TaxID=6293 RepID=A0A3P7DZY5_WUCBA|nr:unnamed protein product [Wuchereria bancrofti]
MKLSLFVNNDLDQLAQLNERLLERSRGRRTDYKLIDSEIIKSAPEPVPATVKEQIRDMLESRISNDTSVNSTIPQQDRSGYVTVRYALFRERKPIKNYFTFSFTIL